MAEEETVLEDYWLFRNEKGLPVAVLDSEPKEGITNSKDDQSTLKMNQVHLNRYDCWKRHWALDDEDQHDLPAYIHGIDCAVTWEYIGCAERIDKQDYEMCIAFGLCKDG